MGNYGVKFRLWVCALCVPWFALASSLEFQQTLNSLVGAPPNEILKMEDIHYCNGGGHYLYVDLFRSKRFLDKTLHAVIIVHDDLISGDRSAESEALAKYAANLGYVAATIDYRLSGLKVSDSDPTNDRLQVGATFPDAVLDVRCAVRWLRANSEEIGTVPGRVSLIGMGAGGYLALLAGLMGESRKLPKSGDLTSLARAVTTDVRSVVSISAPTTALTQYWYETSPRSRGKQEISKMVAADPRKQKDLFDLASPTTYIGPDSAPVLSIHGTNDRFFPFDAVNNFDALMAAKEVPHTLIPVAGVGYEFREPKGRINKRALERVLKVAFEYIKITQRYDPVDVIQKAQEELERTQQRQLAAEEDWW